MGSADAGIRRPLAEPFPRAGGRLGRQGRFEYETHSDDGNPTAALWSWHVTPVRHRLRGSTVTWAVYPRTWGGQELLGARIRRPALITEVRTSLAGLDAHLPPGQSRRAARQVMTR